jgi:UV DNA damage endonuclease
MGGCGVFYERRGRRGSGIEPFVSPLRLGLCCTFSTQPIKFRITTARRAGGLAAGARAAVYAELVLHNARAVGEAVAWCAANGVGAYRVPSQIFPLYTHPDVGYRWTDLPNATDVEAILRRVRRRAAEADVRLSFHPDQFVVPGSANPATVAASLAELEYQAEVAGLLGAAQITIHGGGAQGGKGAALERLVAGLDRLSPGARALVVLENDDRVYTVEDLLPVCRAAGVPLVYDVHHHRCHPDALSIDEATAAAALTWGEREPWLHLSSPAAGWGGGDPRPHADEIDLRDLPEGWRGLRATVDVEAKAKEVAVLALRRALERGGAAVKRRPSGGRGTRAPAPR